MQKKTLSFVKIKYLLPLFVLSIAVAVPLRIYQFWFLIDSKTGFYKTINWSVYTLYAVLVIFGLLFIVLSMFGDEAIAPKAPGGKNKFLGYAAFALSICFVVDAVKQISAVVFAVLGYSNNINLSLFKYLVSSGYIPIVFQAVFALTSCIYMMVFGLSYINGKNTFEDSKLLALAPMLWAACKMITRLMRPISYVKVSELLLELFLMSFLMLSFLALARVSSQLSVEGAMRKILAYGFLASLLGFICSIPRLALILAGRSSMVTTDSPFDICDLGCGIFFIVFIASAMYFGSREVPVQIAEEVADLAIDDDFLSEE